MARPAWLAPVVARSARSNDLSTVPLSSDGLSSMAEGMELAAADFGLLGFGLLNRGLLGRGVP